MAKRTNTVANAIYKEYTEETQNFMFSVHKYLRKKFGEINDEWIGSLKMLAENYELFIQCSKEIKEKGLLIQDRFNALIKNPLLKVQTDAQIQCVKLLQEFALTPKAAARLKDDADDNAEEYLQELING